MLRQIMALKINVMNTNIHKFTACETWKNWRGGINELRRKYARAILNTPMTKIIVIAILQ